MRLCKDPDRREVSGMARGNCGCTCGGQGMTAVKMTAAWKALGQGR